MNKLKYALYHGKIVLVILIIAVIFASTFINDTIMQINSAKNGIEVLLIDTAFSTSTKTLEKEIKNATGVKFVGAASLIKSDAEEYVKTIENYTVEDYIYYLTQVKNCEAVFVTKNMLNSIYTLKNIVPLSIEGEFDEICYFNGVLYAFPMKTSALQQDTYMILLNGDHVEYMRQYLTYLVAEAE